MNEYFNTDTKGCMLLRITNRNYSGDVLFDTADYPDVFVHTWHVKKDGYVVTTVMEGSGGKRDVSMHRMLLGIGSEKYDRYSMIDHENRNRADNRRSNISVVTGTRNQLNRKKSAINTSGRTGVCVHTDSRSSRRYWKGQMNFKTGIKARYFPVDVHGEEGAMLLAERYRESPEAQFGCTTEK